jgi:hypothetical protein
VSEARTIRLALSPEAERYVRREAPAEVRLLAAAGALPLPPVELVTVLFVLAHDPEAPVKERARQSLERLPEGVLAAALSGPAHPAVLSFCAHAFRDLPERLERIALNPAADDATIAFLAGLPHRRVVEIVSNNQARLLRAPEIVEALGSNPATGRAAIDRILAFLGVERPDHEEADEVEADLPLPPPPPLSDEEAQAVLAAVLGDDASSFAPELVQESVPLTPETHQSLHALIQKMSVFEKVKLARLGNAEARSLLVRDRNKLVAAAAVRSPKVQEQEVLAFAKARNVAEEVLRIVASSREWTRSYAVKLALVANPKCPQPWAIRFLNYLQECDLRAIMKSKDVPTAVSTHARRMLQRKGKI